MPLAPKPADLSAGLHRTYDARPRMPLSPKPADLSAGLHRTYDARGNMTTVPRPADLEETLTCTYDSWNRLIEVWDDESETLIQKNEYDGLNRRIKKHADTDAPAEKAQTGGEKPVMSPFPPAPFPPA